jgi:hypothetical protein
MYSTHNNTVQMESYTDENKANKWKRVN